MSTQVQSISSGFSYSWQQFLSGIESNDTRLSLPTLQWCSAATVGPSAWLHVHCLFAHANKNCHLVHSGQQFRSGMCELKQWESFPHQPESQHCSKRNAFAPYAIDKCMWHLTMMSKCRMHLPIIAAVNTDHRGHLTWNFSTVLSDLTKEYTTRQWTKKTPTSTPRPKLILTLWFCKVTGTPPVKEFTQFLVAFVSHGVSKRTQKGLWSHAMTEQVFLSNEGNVDCVRY